MSFAVPLVDFPVNQISIVIAPDLLQSDDISMSHDSDLPFDKLIAPGCSHVLHEWQPIGSSLPNLPFSPLTMLPLMEP